MAERRTVPNHKDGTAAAVMVDTGMTQKVKQSTVQPQIEIQGASLNHYRV